MKKRVGHLLLIDSLGGVENWYLDMARNGMFSSGKHVIYGAGKEIDKEVEKQLSKYVTVASIPKDSLFRMIQFISKTNLEYIYNHTYFRGTLVLLIFKVFTNAKIITHNHSAAISRAKTLKVRLLLMALKRIINYCTDIRVAVSSNAAVDLFDSQKNVKILPCVLSTYAEKRLVKCKVDSPNKKLRLLHIGRVFNSNYFEDAKNQSFIVDVLYWLQKKKVNFEMTFCGGGDLDYLKKKLSFLGVDAQYVKFKKQVNSFDELAKTDVFLFPSKHEGYGMALVEAQYSNVECIVSPDIPEEAILTANLVKRLEIQVNHASLWADEIIKKTNVNLNSIPLPQYPEYLKDVNSIFDGN